MSTNLKALATFLAEARKAVVAAGGAAIAVLGPKVYNGQTPTKADYATAIGFAVLAFIGVFFTTNQAPAAKPAA